MRALVFIAVLFSYSAFSAELVIVHSEKPFNTSTRVALKRLMTSQKFDSIVALTAHDEVNYDRTLVTAEYSSSGGENQVHLDSPDLVLAGGYFNWCLATALNDLFSHNPGLARVTFDSQTIFALASHVNHNSNLNLDTKEAFQAATLAEVFRALEADHRSPIDWIRSYLIPQLTLRKWAKISLYWNGKFRGSIRGRDDSEERVLSLYFNP